MKKLKKFSIVEKEEAYSLTKKMLDELVDIPQVFIFYSIF